MINPDKIWTLCRETPRKWGKQKFDQFGQIWDLNFSGLFNSKPIEFVAEASGNLAEAAMVRMWMTNANS